MQIQYSNLCIGIWLVYETSQINIYRYKWEFEKGVYLADNQLYWERVGSLIYIMMTTKTDLYYILTWLLQ